MCPALDAYQDQSTETAKHQDCGECQTGKTIIDAGVHQLKRPDSDRRLTGWQQQDTHRYIARRQDPSQQAADPYHRATLRQDD